MNAVSARFCFSLFFPISSIILICPSFVPYHNSLYSHWTVIADVVVVRLVPGTSAETPGQTAAYFVRCSPDHLRVMPDNVQFVIRRSVGEVLSLREPHSHGK